jgi:hypothetical protein
MHAMKQNRMMRHVIIHVGAISTWEQSNKVSRETDGHPRTWCVINDLHMVNICESYCHLNFDTRVRPDP